MSADTLPVEVIEALVAAHVPPLPQALLRLLQVVDDDHSSIATLAQIVERDPGLSMRVLTAANSVALRRGHELTTISECLVALGTRIVKTMATCLSVRAMFERRNGQPRVALESYWAHSLLVAELSRELAVDVGGVRPDEAYLAGLLHDVGLLVAARALGEPYAEVLAAADDETALLIHERARFDTDHTEIGGWLAEHWLFPGEFADSILFHHVPAEGIATAGRLPKTVWLAHALLGSGATASDGVLVQPLDEARAVAALAAACGRVQEIAGAIGVVLPAGWQHGGGRHGLPQVARGPGGPVADPAECAIVDAMAGQALRHALGEPGSDDACDDAMEALLDALRQAVHILYDAVRVVFLLPGAQAGELRADPVGGKAAVFRRNEFRPARQLLAVERAVSEGRVIATLTEASPPALLDVQMTRALGADGLFCVPMPEAAGAGGALMIGVSHRENLALVARTEALEQFGRLAGVVLAAMRQRQERRVQEHGTLAALHERRIRRAAHETGNPLGIIKTYLHLLQGKLPADAQVEGEITVLREEIDRVALIIDQLGAASGVLVPDGLAVKPLIEELLKGYGVSLFQSRGIDVALRAEGAETATVHCPRDRLIQILLNLWKNAADAMVAGGHFVIHLLPDVAYGGRPHVEIRMDDSGPGLPEAGRRCLTGDGDAGAPADGEARRGLGLSIVNHLVREVGGAIIVRPAEGLPGTGVAILLPSEAADGRQKRS